MEIKKATYQQEKVSFHYIQNVWILKGKNKVRHKAIYNWNLCINTFLLIEVCQYSTRLKQYIRLIRFVKKNNSFNIFFLYHTYLSRITLNFFLFKMVNTEHLSSRLPPLAWFYYLEWLYLLGFLHTRKLKGNVKHSPFFKGRL